MKMSNTGLRDVTQQANCTVTVVAQQLWLSLSTYIYLYDSTASGVGGGREGEKKKDDKYPKDVAVLGWLPVQAKKTRGPTTEKMYSYSSRCTPVALRVV